MITKAQGKISDPEKTVKDLEILGKKNKVLIQIIDAESIYSKLHVISSIEHAIRSFHHNDNATSTLQLELLLYLAGERQIHKAIKKVGVNQHSTDFIIIIVGEIKAFKDCNGKLSNTLMDSVLKTIHLKQNDDEISGNQTTLKKFGITQKEIDTVTADKYEGLILEKIAMVDIKK